MNGINKTALEKRIEELISAYCSKYGHLLGFESVKTVCDQAVISGRNGKRLRAMLLITAARFATQRAEQNNFFNALEESKVFDIACALEIFQTAALVHDDIIDNADVRRGQPSAHKALSYLTKKPDETVGTGLGIMLGDILATVSVQAVNAAASGFFLHGSILADFLGMQQMVEFGQVMDISSEITDLSKAKNLTLIAETVYQFKTASYTTIAPLALGFMCAGIEPDTARKIALKAGKPVGVAFQIADDLLDIISTEKDTGKPIGGDIREGKRTSIFADTLNALKEGGSGSREDYLWLLDFYADRKKDSEGVKRVADLMHSTGAIERAKNRTEDLLKSAQYEIMSCSGEILTNEGKENICRAFNAFIPEKIFK